MIWTAQIIKFNNCLIVSLAIGKKSTLKINYCCLSSAYFLSTLTALAAWSTAFFLQSTISMIVSVLLTGKSVSTRHSETEIREKADCAQLYSKSWEECKIRFVDSWQGLETCITAWKNWSQAKIRSRILWQVSNYQFKEIQCPFL